LVCGHEVIVVHDVRLNVVAEVRSGRRLEIKAARGQLVENALIADIFARLDVLQGDAERKLPRQ
jgi:hypothetical protein